MKPSAISGSSENTKRAEQNDPTDHVSSSTRGGRLDHVDLKIRGGVEGHDLVWTYPFGRR